MKSRPGQAGNLAAQSEKSKAKKDAVIDALKAGKSVRSIIKELNVSQKTVTKLKAELKLPEQTDVIEFLVPAEQKDSAPF